MKKTNKEGMVEIDDKGYGRHNWQEMMILRIMKIKERQRDREKNGEEKGVEKTLSKQE